MKDAKPMTNNERFKAYSIRAQKCIRKGNFRAYLCTMYDLARVLRNEERWHSELKVLIVIFHVTVMWRKDIPRNAIAYARDAIRNKKLSQADIEDMYLDLIRTDNCTRWLSPKDSLLLFKLALANIDKAHEEMKKIAC